MRDVSRYLRVRRRLRAEPDPELRRRMLAIWERRHAGRGVLALACALLFVIPFVPSLLEHLVWPLLKGPAGGVGIVAHQLLVRSSFQRRDAAARQLGSMAPWMAPAARRLDEIAGDP